MFFVKNLVILVFFLVLNKSVKSVILLSIVGGMHYDRRTV